VLVHRAITRVLAAASVVLVVVGANPSVAAAAPPPSLAVFEWYRLSQLNAKVSEPRLNTLRTDGFKTVYANVGEYLEVADQPASRTQQTRLNQLKSDLKRFVARASSAGFAVHAVDGGPTGPTPHTATWAPSSSSSSPTTTGPPPPTSASRAFSWTSSRTSTQASSRT
jgi:hypothetical protein